MSVIDRFQIWQCVRCGRLRHWGFGYRCDVLAAPERYQLQCGGCGKVTPHIYNAVVMGRVSHPEIDWGHYDRLRQDAEVVW